LQRFSNLRRSKFLRNAVIPAKAGIQINNVKAGFPPSRE
jgi:hypothetical protein